MAGLRNRRGRDALSHRARPRLDRRADDWPREGRNGRECLMQHKPVEWDQQQEFIVEARTTYRVVAPSLERALAAFSDWEDDAVDIYTEAFADVRPVAPARSRLFVWLKRTTGRRGTPIPWGIIGSLRGLPALPARQTTTA